MDSCVDRPIFILGPGRSGTTLLYQCFTSHPAVGFFNRANKKWPNHPRIAHTMTKLGLYADSARESKDLWNRFRTHWDHDQMEADEVTEPVRSWYQQRIQQVLRARGATRFAAKFPSHSLRVPWLNAVFPDAIFVQCIRDWRSVVSSTIAKAKRDFPGQFFGVAAPGWKDVVETPLHMKSSWQYARVHEYMETQSTLYGDRYVKLFYEELCEQPMQVLEDLFTKCGLEWSEQVKEALPPKIGPISRRSLALLTDEILQEIRGAYGDTLARYEHPLLDQTGSPTIS